MRTIRSLTELFINSCRESTSARGLQKLVRVVDELLCDRWQSSTASETFLKLEIAVSCALPNQSAISKMRYSAVQKTFAILILVASSKVWALQRVYQLRPLRKSNILTNFVDIRSNKFLGSSACCERATSMFLIDKSSSDSDVELQLSVKKEGKLQALWNKYGAFYFQVWFCIYLPFLLSFFYVLDNNLLKASALEAIDPQAAVLKLFSWLESVTNNAELLRGVRENPRVTTFATAYLLADLVPTTVFALAVVTYVIKRRERMQEDIADGDSDIGQ